MSLQWEDATARLVLSANAEIERACLDQAKAELEREANSGIDFAVRLIQRAQQIKLRGQQ